MEARNKIVEGSVQIVHDAIQKLQERGIELDEETIEDLVNKLMVVTCSD